MDKWEVLSGQVKDKRGQMLYHVRCRKCRTVRVLTAQEAREDCDCDYNFNERGASY